MNRYTLLRLLLPALVGLGCTGVNVDTFDSKELAVDPPSRDVRELNALRDSLVRCINDGDGAGVRGMMHPEHLDPNQTAFALTVPLRALDSLFGPVTSTTTLEAYYADFAESMPREQDGHFSYTFGSVDSELLGDETTLRSPLTGRVYYLVSRAFCGQKASPALFILAKEYEGSFRLISFDARLTDVRGKDAAWFATRAINFSESGKPRVAFLYRELSSWLSVATMIPGYFRELAESTSALPPEGLPRLKFREPSEWRLPNGTRVVVTDIRPRLSIDTVAVTLSYESKVTDPMSAAASAERREVFRGIAENIPEIRDVFDGFYIMSIADDGRKAEEFIPTSSPL